MEWGEAELVSVLIACKSKAEGVYQGHGSPDVLQALQELPDLGQEGQLTLPRVNGLHRVVMLPSRYLACA